MIMGAASTVLITGFGPFPGVADNVSGRLALRLAEERARTGVPIEAHILPTEWEEVSKRFPAVLVGLRPRLVLHLGVARRARGFRIERRAENATEAKLDAGGRFPLSSTICDGGPAALTTNLPVAPLVRSLRDQGLPGAASNHCGNYLCNFLFYRSLDWARRQPSPCEVLFLHLPLRTTRAGNPLSETELWRGAASILDALLARIDMSEGRMTARRDRAPRMTATAPT
jgi:pyroglutamyl-peptidase